MKGPEILELALRVLKSLMSGEPSPNDIHALKQHALPEEINLAAHDLACVIISRECRKTIAAANVATKRKRSG